MVACIIAALQYLHLNNVIHRDLKPENLVFDRTGYLRLTDLGVSRQNKPNNAADTSGTPGYMAPEVICRRDHSFPVDFFALGIIAYEMMLGKVCKWILCRGPMSGGIGLKSEIKSSQNKPKYKTFPKAGTRPPSTS